MAIALILVAIFVGAFFFWEGKHAIETEIRGRAISLARELSFLTADDIITANRYEIYKKLEARFAADNDGLSGADLLYLMVYKHNGELLIGSSSTVVFFDRASYFYTLPSENKAALDDVSLGRDALKSTGPISLFKKTGVYELTYPVMAGSDRVGFIRLGISGARYEKKISAMMKKAVFALLGSLLVGLVFSRIIALGITRPISQLSKAAANLSKQNWDTPIPLRGRGEIGKLGDAFNQMALTLKQREASLSRGNRDLFILHTAGLDLMESLEIDTLLVKVAGRAEDLVRADTVALSVVDNSKKVLKYLGVFGSLADALTALDMPVEAGGIYNWLVSYGTPLLVSDAQSDFRLSGEEMKSLGIRCVMAVPLWSSNKMMGLLTAINKKSGTCFDKHDLRLFTVFSNLVGAALQNASLYADLHGKIDELNSAQGQLVRSAKMAAIGELAANVAHEINNPLTSVLGYASHLLKTLDLQESPRRMLQMMEQETLRVRKIIRNLLDFSRQRPSWMQPADLLLPLRETVAFVQGAAEAASVNICEEYDSSPLIVNMDSNEMKQVFINIINNALQAMPRGGTLRIRAGITLQNETVVEFADSGIGISEEIKSKIFDPFFSTKEEGDGTGLGLSISYRIVQNHGGRIEIESEVGKGSVFRVLLPLHRQDRVSRQA